jgi:hypothetical protein
VIESWTCEICGDRRPDAMIAVASAFSRSLTRNVHYCADRPECAAAARERADADAARWGAGPERGSVRVAHYHFPRLWRGRHDERIVTFANGHVYDRAERRRSLRQLVRMMRREKTE